MGLDMYLVRKKYIGANYEHNEVKGTIDLTSKGKKIPIDLNKVTEIYEQVGYWRKANQIHKWFVDNVQDGIDDGGAYYVSDDDLKKLLAKCKEVEKKAILVDGKVKVSERFVDGKFVPIYEDGMVIENAEEIAKILPTQEGFFFGCTDYDEDYMEDIKDTIKIIESILEEEKILNEQRIWSEFEYSASW